MEALAQQGDQESLSCVVWCPCQDLIMHPLHCRARLRRHSIGTGSECASGAEPPTRLGTGMLDHTTVLACLDQCLAYFALLDLTGDGLITTREMARAERSSLVALQMPPAVHTAVAGRFLALDANSDGLITRREFVSALGATMAEQVHQ